MKYAFALITCLVIHQYTVAQILTHKWRASAVNMYGTFYNIQGAETPEAITAFYTNLVKENDGERFTAEDSAMSVLSYLILMEYATDIGLEFTQEGKVSYTAHIMTKRELHTETGTYKVKGNAIRTNLKGVKSPEFIIVSLTETELVLNGVLGTDKFSVKFVRVD